MARKRGSGAPTPLVGLLVVAALAGGGWFVLQRRPHLAQLWPVATATKPAPTTPTTPAAPVAVVGDRIDPRNDGRNVIVSGSVRVTAPARDAELGISADAVALLRQVEMRQWREKCTAAACDYALVWSAQPIDWHAFRERKGHENAMPFPFSAQRFLAGGVRIGAFSVDPALAAAAGEPIAYPVHVTQLPPNLAATFREQTGVLYTGASDSHPAAGDLRISYRIVPAGEQRLRGVQGGGRLKAPPSH